MVYYLSFISILSVFSLIKSHARVCLAFWEKFIMFRLISLYLLWLKIYIEYVISLYLTIDKFLD